METTMRKILLSFVIAGLVLLGDRLLFAWGGQTPNDFVTGGGWIVGTPSGAKGNFGVGGGVKNGAFWGHLNYLDHGTGLHVQATSITGYRIFEDGSTPSRTRDICGTYKTDTGESGYFLVRVTDNGEPGRDDFFGIKLQSGYVAYGDLGGSSAGGGNIQLHKGNASNTPPATASFCPVSG
jgi:hypothetical protein